MPNKEIDPVLEGLTEQELKNTIVKNVRQQFSIQEDAKAYAKSSREAIKALEERNKECLELLATKT